MTEWEEVHQRNLRKGLRELEEEADFGYDIYGIAFTEEDARSAYYDDLLHASREGEY